MTDYVDLRLKYRSSYQRRLLHFLAKTRVPNKRCRSMSVASARYISSVPVILKIRFSDRHSL